MELEFTFYYLNVWQWLGLATICIGSLIPAIRILRRLDVGPWWALLLIVPFIHLVALWVLAYSGRAARKQLSSRSRADA
jgi:hypothetical protein